MATLKNLTITDTGYLNIASGTGAQRPGVTLAGINNSATYGNLGVATDGLRLTIGGNGTTWSSYQNLPLYLQGLVCTTSINDSSAMTWAIDYPCRVYMLRVPTWNTVDTVGWTSYETGKNYISGETSVTVFYKDFAAGSFSFDNDSAMYMFQFTTLAGTIRYNTTKSVFEGYTGQTWTPLNTFRPGNTTVITSTPAPGTWAVPPGTSFVNVLLVGGGGGGGLCMGGGGGGGGVRYLTNVPVPPGGTMTLTVGAGGGGGTGRSIPGTKGGNSQFGTFVAAGGGGGASWDSTAGNATAGGSGGGGCQPGASSVGNTPPTNPPQGYPGASSGGAIGSYQASGGGGGAGGQGFTGTPYQGGRGGPGVQYAGIGGANTNSLSGSGGARNTFGGGGMFGGGGGGGTNGGRPGVGSDGGGDGTGANGTGAAGLTNAGGGGGGGGHGPDGPGGAGGSGIVIIQEITNQSV